MSHANHRRQDSGQPAARATHHALGRNAQLEGQLRLLCSLIPALQVIRHLCQISPPQPLGAHQALYHYPGLPMLLLWVV